MNIKDCMLGISLIFVIAICTFVPARGDLTDTFAEITPGRVVILAESGFTPSIHSLLPDVPLTQFKAYSAWQVTSLGETYFPQRATVKSARPSLLDDIYILSFPDTVDVFQVIARVSSNPGVRYVEPDYKLELFSWPTDPLFPNQWYLNNTGQQFYAIDRIEGDSNDVLYLKRGLPGEDINMAPLYDNPPQDSVEVLLAIIDTGIDYDHPELVDKIYRNFKEIPDNGVDDDNNGLTDDYRGWDFSGDTIISVGIEGDNDCTDSIGHGTHLAGIISALQNNIGIAGFPAKIKILPIKIFPNGLQTVSIAAILYAADMGARVINMSWGTLYESYIMRLALQYALDRECLPVAAAGNFGSSDPTFPASFPETFAIGGTDSDGYMTFYSTYGPFLDMSAPGRNILSLRARGTDLYYPEEPDIRIIDEKYILADGTSMSAPMVAGAAALLLSYNPSLRVEEIKNVLEQSADDLVDPWGDGQSLPGYDTLSGWGRLNVGRAVEMLLAPTAYLSSPEENAVISGNVAVGITTTGGYAGPADLYIGEGRIPESWTLLYHADVAATADTFFVWDSDALSGYYVLRLETDAGFNQVDIRLVNGTVVEIISPDEGSEVKYYIPVIGTIYDVGLDSAVLSFRYVDQVTYKHLFSGSKFYFNEKIFTWLHASSDDGPGFLKLEAFCGPSVYVDSTALTVVSDLREGFPVNFPSYLSITCNTADIDGDGYKEIAVGCARGLYVYRHDGTLQDGFPVMTGRDMRTIPAFDDIDGDGLLDVIASGDSVIACVNYRGEPVYGWPKSVTTGMLYSSYPVTVPVQLQPEDDSTVIYFNRYGEIYAYRFDGTPYFYSLGGIFTALDPNLFDSAFTTGVILPPFLTSTDLNADGSTEVIGMISTAGTASGIYIWNGRNGRPAFGWPTARARRFKKVLGGTLADVDNDGMYELVAAVLDTNSNYAISVTKYGQEELPGWPVVFEGVNDNMWLGTAPVCVDIDNDGFKELFVSFFGIGIGRIYAFNYDGTPFLDGTFPRGAFITTSCTLSNVIIADVDGDGVADVLSRGGNVFPAGGNPETVQAWNLNAEPLDGFPLVTTTAMVTSTPHTPLVDDLDGDGLTEILMTGDDGDLFVWNMKTPYDTSVMLWRKYLGDIKNSGINPDRADPTDVDDGEAVRPMTFAIESNYPNPFNPATTIRFSLDRAGEIALEVFNVLGQKVTTVASGWHAAGRHEVIWDGTNGAGNEVASGVYFARLRGENQFVTRKMMLLR